MSLLQDTSNHSRSQDSPLDPALNWDEIEARIQAKDPERFERDSKMLELLDRLKETQDLQLALNSAWISEMERKPIEWLWAPRVPLGTITLLDGDPGSGKTFVTMALAAAVSRGWALRDEKGQAEPRVALLINTEDDPARIIRPRLEDMGADLTRIAILRSVFTQDEYGNPTGERIFSLATDLPLLERWVRLYRPALVVIDPFQAHIGGRTDIHRANETRSILAPLALLAERERFAVVIVRHLNKAGGLKALYRGLGSIDLPGIARSVLFVAEHPEERGRRFLVQIKANFGPMAPALEFCIDPPAGDFGWVGESDITAEELLGLPIKARMSPEREEIVDILKAKGQPMSPKEVAEELDKEHSTVKFLMFKMAEKGQLRKTGYGKYVPAKSPNFANSTNSTNSANSTNSLEDRERRVSKVSKVGEVSRVTGETKVTEITQNNQHSSDDPWALLASVTPCARCGQIAWRQGSEGWLCGFCHPNGRANGEV